MAVGGIFRPWRERASWLDGEVRRHCVHCHAEVALFDRECSDCGAELRKECPECHYWVEMDATFCPSCRHAFPLPPPPRATVRLWHPDDASVK